MNVHAHFLLPDGSTIELTANTTPATHARLLHAVPKLALACGAIGVPGPLHHVGSVDPDVEFTPEQQARVADMADDLVANIRLVEDPIAAMSYAQEFAGMVEEWTMQARQLRAQASTPEEGNT